MKTEIEKPTQPAGISFGLPHDFWERVRYTSSRLLMLDYDGTLAPFSAESSKGSGKAVLLPNTT